MPPDSPQPLRDLRVVDFSSQIAGPYATKLFVDAGADVIKVESESGDPLRAWSATGADLAGEDGALFRFLNHGKRSVVGRPGDEAVLELVATADLVVDDFAPGVLDALDLPGRFPGLVWLSITPWGRGGPWDGRPWSEFTVQAQCGSIGVRGLPGREPFQCGGRTTEWLAGTFAAVGALAAVQKARRTGHGEHVDFSIQEVMTIAGTNYVDLMFQMLGVEAEGPLPQTVETPSIEPTQDGYVGFCTNSRQQFSDFLLMIGRHDLQEDEQLAQVAGRMARFDEWNEIVHAWTREHTTADVVEQASLLRIPVAPVNSGDTVRSHEQLVARGAIREDPTGRFQHPRPPYRLDACEPAAQRTAPALGEHTGRIEPRDVARPAPGAPGGLPLAGLRVLDLTAWWAGPSAAQMMAALGAEVIHVESAKRPDGMRMVGGMLGVKFDAWWEASPFFLASNANKTGLALDLSTDEGKSLLRRLVAECDAVVENFTPRVMENFGLDWETIRERNSRCIFLRMPAFGLSGPWRDNTGFAQTMEQMTGLAWLTGHPDDQPRIQRGPCDPLAGMHAVFAFLVALAERERTGRGIHVEATMVEGALNVAAEQLIEFTAYGNLLQRDGNRCPEAAPQGLYPCAGSEPGQEQWLALSVHTDAEWEALCELLGRPAWTQKPELAHFAGRRAARDAIDAELRPWIAERDRAELVETLLAAGVPAAPVADPRGCRHNPQMVARGFFEAVDHPVVGNILVPTLPFRYASVERWTRFPAPTLGQHNREVLGRLLGLDGAELDRLEAAGVIGDQLVGL
ncbi:MAG: CoA transferase [Myxococcota bacterium]|nr:CoA transferase [Myxococcota bacterium]